MVLHEVKSFLLKNNIKYDEIKRIDTLADYVYKVSSQKNYFLKIIKGNDVKALKIKNVYALLKKNNIPAPEVLKFEKKNDKAFLLMTEAEGHMLKEVIKNYAEEDLKKLYYDFGVKTAKLHSITFDKFGELITEKVEKVHFLDGKGPFNSWSEMHKELINDRLKTFKGTPFEKYMVPIKKWFEKNEMKTKVTPRLLHEDLNQKNIFVKNNSVTGFIDVDDSYIGHNEEELMRIENAHFEGKEWLRKEFLKGYQTIIKLDEGYEKRRKFYYLSRYLVHMECFIMFGTNYVKDEDKGTKEIIKTLKEYGIL